MSKRKPLIYHYRGPIERGSNYAWRDGYSSKGKGGGVIYPWSTRRECKSEAKAMGMKAVFWRDGKPEPGPKRPELREWRRVAARRYCG